MNAAHESEFIPLVCVLSRLSGVCLFSFFLKLIISLLISVRREARNRRPTRNHFSQTYLKIYSFYNKKEKNTDAEPPS